MVDNRTRALYKEEAFKLRGYERYRDIQSRPPLTDQEIEDLREERRLEKQAIQDAKDKTKQWRLDNADFLTQRRAEKKIRDAHKKVIKDIRSVGEKWVEAPPTLMARLLIADTTAQILRWMNTN